ncbi:acetyltransferase [Streptomyces clavuligerus]|nr:acetyltransferase [Streptomyces clavuligerus]MBY6307833.1 acetyltransferase [Streptomyces clavuligerus]QPJ98337.1 acetyltransferase [Streptomyces clavuligerus]WDN56335.1 acetyltransferase [Streptomyces clavuligerus]
MSHGVRLARQRRERRNLCVRRRAAPPPSSLKDLLIIGAGGMGRALARMCSQATDEAGARRWQVQGFIDEDRELHGTRVDGLPVLGGLEAVERYPGADLVISICHVAHQGARRRIAQALGLPSHRYPTIVHRTAIIDPSCAMGHGTVLMPMVCVLPGVTIGNYVIVRPQSMMAADVVVQDYGTVAAQVFLGRCAVVEEGAYVGAGAKVREYASVGPGSVVGMGSLVLDHVPGGEIWAGNPLRRLAPGSRLTDRGPT